MALRKRGRHPPWRGGGGVAILPPCAERACSSGRNYACQRKEPGLKCANAAPNPDAYTANVRLNPDVGRCYVFSVIVVHKYSVSMPKDKPSETAYSQLLQQFRQKSSDDVWLGMHADPLELAYKLAGERVLSERAESAVQQRARWAFRVSLAALLVSFGSFYVSSKRGLDNQRRQDAIVHHVPATPAISLPPRQPTPATPPDALSALPPPSNVPSPATSAPPLAPPQTQSGKP